MADKEQPLVKQCRVKSQALVRYQKEYNSYLKEVTMNENKITSMIADNKCEHEVAKMREVLKETEVMIPIIKDKLTECVDDLEEFMEENGEEVKKLNEEIHDKAVEQIALSKGFLESLHEEEIGNTQEKMDVKAEDKIKDQAEE